MSLSRRELSALLTALFAAQSGGQTTSSGVLPSKAYQYSELPAKTNAENGAESRSVFRGETHGGFEIACHMTKLMPGTMPHPPHKHANEEILFIREGTLDVTIEGKTSRIGPGSLIYIASNELHGAKNTGTVPAQYFVLELDGQKS